MLRSTSRFCCRIPDIIGNLKSLTMASANESKCTLEGLNLDTLALQSLPIDKETRNYVRSVSGACFSKVSPTPLTEPQLVGVSCDALSLIDLDEQEANRPEFAEYMAGNKLFPGSVTASHCYCGHQFGAFAGQLGDGAAIYLGERVNKNGERWEIQLKGAGLTPYSRSADGRKVLRSSIREFLASEAMAWLGVPTTRAASCVTSRKDKVMRDQFYDGHPRQEQCSVVCRLAPTFIRFGSFEIFKTRDSMTGATGPSVGRYDILHQLLDYCTETFYPEIHNRYPGQELKDRENRTADFYQEVVIRTAQMVAWWQCVGFCHGVLNTDNMSIMGLTIDYGPYGFLDRFDPDHICNSSDDGGRYTYTKQPEICCWNLLKFAQALEPVLPAERAKDILNKEYFPTFRKVYSEKMHAKLGLIGTIDSENDSRTDEEKEGILSDSALVELFHSVMAKTGSDFTNSFRALNMLVLPGMEGSEQSFDKYLKYILTQCSSIDELIESHKMAMNSQQFQMFLLILQSNPGLLDQLGKGPKAIERVLAQLEEVERLKNMDPTKKKEEDEKLWKDFLDKYRDRLASDCLPFDGDMTSLKASALDRVRRLNSANPRIVLRNWMAQAAIDEAEKGSYEEVKRLLTILRTPYEPLDEVMDMNDIGDMSQCSVSGPSGSRDASGWSYTRKPPSWSCKLKVSCSS